MKPNVRNRIVAALVVLVAGAFWVGRASATTGCFSDTNGHLFETFICWLDDNNITHGYGDGTFGPNDNVTRGQMAVFMQRMRTTGLMQINVGPGNWVTNGVGTTHYIEHFSAFDRLRTTGNGAHGFGMTAAIPGSLFNSLMYFNGIKLCYKADAGATLSEVHVEHFLNNGSLLNIFSDTANRSDNTCRNYMFPTGQALFGGEYASIYIVVEFPSNLVALDVRSVTFFLSPSAFPAVPDPAGPDSELRPALDLPIPGAP
jgi:hypothetical protein